MWYFLSVWPFLSPFASETKNTSRLSQKLLETLWDSLRLSVDIPWPKHNRVLVFTCHCIKDSEKCHHNNCGTQQVLGEGHNPRGWENGLQGGGSQKWNFCQQVTNSILLKLVENKGAVSSCGVPTGKQQQRAPQEPHLHQVPITSQNTSQITAWGGTLSQAFPLFSPPIINPTSAVFVKIIFSHQAQSSGLHLPLSPSRDDPAPAVSLNPPAWHHRTVVPLPDGLLCATGTGGQKVLACSFYESEAEQKLPCIYRVGVSLSTLINQGGGCTQHQVIGCLGT